MCLSAQDDLPELGASPSRYPDIHAGGIYDRTKVSPGSPLARQHCLACGVIAQDRNSVRIRERPCSVVWAGIVFPYIGCYHPSVAIIAGGSLCLIEMVAAGCCGFLPGWELARPLEFCTLRSRAAKPVSS